MLLAPLLGWLYLSAKDESITWFLLPMPASAPVSEVLAEFSEETHEVLGLSVYLFIVIHALAGL
mgnify:CR=1 FL=1|jgi:cytochrome b561